MISPGHAIPFIECCYFTMDDLHDSPSPQATELFLRAVQEEQNGAFYEGMYVGFTVTNERMKCYMNHKKGNDSKAMINSQCKLVENATL